MFQVRISLNEGSIPPPGREISGLWSNCQLRQPDPTNVGLDFFLGRTHTRTHKAEKGVKWSQIPLHVRSAMTQVLTQVLVIPAYRKNATINYLGKGKTYQI